MLGSSPLIAPITLGIYAVLLGVGGLIGYLKAGSRSSLIAGSISALIALAAVALSLADQQQESRHRPRPDPLDQPLHPVWLSLRSQDPEIHAQRTARRRQLDRPGRDVPDHGLDCKAERIRRASRAFRRGRAFPAGQIVAMTVWSLPSFTVRTTIFSSLPGVALAMIQARLPRCSVR